jgi:hypothetical protein
MLFDINVRALERKLARRLGVLCDSECRRGGYCRHLQWLRALAHCWK